MGAWGKEMPRMLGRLMMISSWMNVYNLFTVKGAVPRMVVKLARKTTWSWMSASKPCSAQEDVAEQEDTQLVNRSPETQESGMPEGNYSLMEPQPGQVGWTNDSLEVVAGTGEEGHGGDLRLEGDGGVHGEPQQEGDAQAQVGVRVPQVVVSELVNEQQRPGQEFDKLDIPKLISTWDVMAASAVLEQPGGRKGGG
jgi:hypothetical protein